MTTDVIAVDGDMEVEKVAALMVENGIKRVPVLENDRLAGIISRADIVKTLARRAGS